MSKARLIRSLNCASPRFAHQFGRLSPSVLKEARRALAELLLVDIDNPPAKLHLHAMTQVGVASALDPRKLVKVYSLHLTSNDAYKASFTYEDGCAYFRNCGTHEEIDKNP